MISAGKKLKISRKSMATLSLMLFMFFNPFGFDFVFAAILGLTSSYWITSCILYLLAALFFGFYFLLRNKKRAASLHFLVAGQFLNPLGYDVAFAFAMKLFGGSFILADMSFYAISWLFLGCFFYLSNMNPVIAIKGWISSVAAILTKTR